MGLQRVRHDLVLFTLPFRVMYSWLWSLKEENLAEPGGAQGAAKEGFLISPFYFLELCIQMGISFPIESESHSVVSNSL